MPDDEVGAIRRIRHEISEECGHNVRKVVAYYRAVEKELKQSHDFCFEEGMSPARSEPSVSGAESAK